MGMRLAMQLIYRRGKNIILVRQGKRKSANQEKNVFFR